MTKVFVHSFDTQIGTIHTAATGVGVALISLPVEGREQFETRVRQLIPGCSIAAGAEISLEAERQIRAFLSGSLTTFSLKLDLTGTSFQRQVLKQVSLIPYGTTQTYGAIARKIGNPKAVRAVGMVNARNPLPLVIPCHRVVGTHSLVGYGGGLELKKRLLEMEGALSATLL